MAQCSRCPNTLRNDSKTGLCGPCYRAMLTGNPGDPAHTPAAWIAPPTPSAQVGYDREKRKLLDEIARLKLQYKAALGTISEYEQDQEAMRALSSGQETLHIVPKQGHGTSEATLVALASDWHIEENVGGEVGGLNRYTVDIAERRAIWFFQALLRLTQLLQQDVQINTMVLALLGDFITGNIHGEENAESNGLMPMHAIVRAQNMLISGIEFLLANTQLSFVIPCHSGNHARTTLKTRFTAENGHSLEYLMYIHLAAYFRQESRIQFIIPEGMHSYVEVYDTTIRFHHGHAVKYGGGVGGIYIPVNKAIAQWNKGRQADLDVFGHFHQLRDGGNFICNGSLIGYNAFALSIKADYEQPKQALFLIDKKRGRTCTWPILVNEGERK